MEHQTTIFTVFLIFAGAAIFATLALYLKQSLLVAYMLFGMICGPWGLGIIQSVDLVHRIDDIGIIFLMFLLGLHLKPQSLLSVIYKTSWVVLASSVIFFAVGFAIGHWYGYTLIENLIIGSCMMLSSTIVSLKLLPDHAEKRHNLVEVMIGILLVQDLVAIMILLAIDMLGDQGIGYTNIIFAFLSLPAILLFVSLFEHFVLKKVFAKFSTVHEYTFLVVIAWCLGIAELANLAGLSYEIGAFVAGIAIAASPIAIYISGQMQPIRDFFLVLFFFIVGASFNLRYFDAIIIPAIILTAIFMVLKPLVFRYLLHQINGIKEIAWETGIRLGQLSEFSLLVILSAERSALIGSSVVYLVQAVTMLMFMISSYLVIMRYPMKSLA